MEGRMNLLRSVDGLKDIKDISTLLTYLYMDENHFIKFPPFYNILKLDENFKFRLTVTCTGHTLYHEETPDSLLGIIDYLKDKEYCPEDHGGLQGLYADFKSEWDYIKFTAATCNILNKL